MKIINILRACREVHHKTFFNKNVFVILFFIAVINVSFAQNNYVFGPSIRVNDDPPGSCWHSVRSSGQHGIACRGDTVYVVFDDERNSDYRAVYFSKSTNAGQTWNPNIRVAGGLSNFEASAASIALDNQGWIYIAWHSWEPGPDRNVYFVRSTDGGSSFSDSMLVNDTTRASQAMASIAVDSTGQQVFIAWEDTRNLIDPPNYDIYFSRSTDGGSTFLPSVRIDDMGNDSSWQQKPSISCTRSGDTVYVAWHDDRNGNRDVYLSRSIDGGQIFEPNIIVNDTVSVPLSSQRYPSLWASTSGNVYIVWEDLRQGPSDIYFDKSIDGGLSFGQDVKVTDTLWGSGDCSVTADDSDRIYVAWNDSREFSMYGHDIYFAFSNDSGQTFSPNVLVNDHSGIIDAWDWNANVAVNDDGKVFVAWDTDRNDPAKVDLDIYCATGQYVGIEESDMVHLHERLIKISPNPFKDNVCIELQSVQSNNDVILKIYDSSGRLVNTLPKSSSNTIRWTGLDIMGKELPAGVYFCHVENGEVICIKKIIKIK